MPLLVISSRGVGWITTRSPSGRSFVADAVAVANVHSSWDDGITPASARMAGRRPRVRLRPERCGEVPRRGWAGGPRALRRLGPEPQLRRRRRPLLGPRLAALALSM